MTLENLNTIAQLIAAAAVVASLVFVGVQLRNSTKETQMASLQSVLDGARDRFYVPGYTDPHFLRMFATGLTDMSRLSADEKRQFHVAVLDLCFQMQHVMQLHRHGTLAKVDFDAWLYYTASLFQCPGGRAMWPYITTTITSTIRELIEDYLKKNPDHPSYLDLNPLFRVEAEVGGSPQL